MFSGPKNEEKENRTDTIAGIEVIVQNALFPSLMAQLSGLIIQTQNTSPALFDKIKLQTNEKILKHVKKYVHALIEDIDEQNLMMLRGLMHNESVDNNDVYVILWEACVFNKEALTELFEKLVKNAKPKLYRQIATSTLKLFEQIVDQHRSNSLQNEAT